MTELYPFAVFLVSLALALAFTPLIRARSLRGGFVASPSAGRWHKAPTPLLGGIAIFLSVVPVTAPFLYKFWELRLLGLLGGGFLVFAVGVWDDIQSLRPATKLLAQIVAACLMIFTGVAFDVSGNIFLDFLITIFWVVGITNAFNLIDNMDGLCAGTASIAALTLFAYAFINRDPLVGILTISLAGASLGFLRYNFSPARIFMGDCGSMFIGFILSASAILATSGHAENLVATLMVPVLVLAIPIFDTAFVSLTRLLRGQGIAQGGRDHTSHRLVMLGMSERRTVLLIYALSLLLGVTAFLYAYLNLSVVIIFSIAAIVGLTVLGLFLGEVKIGDSELQSIASARRGDPPAILNTRVLHKRAFLEVLLDLVILGLSYYAANLLRYDNLNAEKIQRIWQTLPVIIPIKLLTFFAFGFYRSMWRYFSLSDLRNLLKAVTVASVLSALAVLIIWRFKGYSRNVFVIDWLLVLLSVGGLRLLFRSLRETLPGIRKKEGKRVVIVGAGDAGEMLLREMMNNPRLGMKPVGFIDDDPGKVGRRMYGIKVMGTRADLGRIISAEGVEEVLVAIPSAHEEALAEIFEQCSQNGVSCRRVHSLL